MPWPIRPNGVEVPLLGFPMALMGEEAAVVSPLTGLTVGHVKVFFGLLGLLGLWLWLLFFLLFSLLLPFLLWGWWGEPINLVYKRLDSFNKLLRQVPERTLTNLSHHTPHKSSQKVLFWLWK